MLVNNFKVLNTWYTGGTFKDVSGTDVSRTDAIGGLYGTNANSHPFQGIALNFEYTSTADTNNYTDEQTAYLWTGITQSGEAYSNNDTSNGFILFVGTGNTAVTTNDYKLANAIDLEVTGASCSHLANNKTNISRTFYNSTGSDVTIKEVGVYMFTTTQTGYETLPIMLGRIVLSTPITITNGDEKTFTYTIDMSNITTT